MMENLVSLNSDLSGGSKIMKWGPNEPLTFKNGGPWNIAAAIIFELWITAMLCEDFQRGIVPYNFYVCLTFFKTKGLPQCHALDPSLWPGGVTVNLHMDWSIPQWKIILEHLVRHSYIIHWLWNSNVLLDIKDWIVRPGVIDLILPLKSQFLDVWPINRFPWNLLYHSRTQWYSWTRSLLSSTATSKIEKSKGKFTPYFPLDDIAESMADDRQSMIV